MGVIEKLKLALSSPMGCATAYWVVVGLFPFLSLWIRQDGLLMMRSYAHFFIYPLFYGPFCVLCMQPPAQFVLKNVRNPALIWAVTLLTALIATLGDATSAKHAIWELKDSAISGQIRSHFSNQGEDFESYREEITNSLRSVSNWSTTRYLYFISLFVQTGVLTGVFVLTGVTVVAPSLERFTAQKPAAIKMLALSYVFAIPWLTFRLLFLMTEKKALYGEPAFASADWCIILCFVAGGMYLLFVLHFKYSDALKAIATGISFLGGVGLVAIVNQLKELPPGFMRGVRIFEYLFALMLVFALIVPWIVDKRRN